MQPKAKTVVSDETENFNSITSSLALDSNKNKSGQLKGCSLALVYLLKKLLDECGLCCTDYFELQWTDCCAIAVMMTILFAITSVLEWHEAYPNHKMVDTTI